MMSISDCRLAIAECRLPIAHYLFWLEFFVALSWNRQTAIANHSAIGNRQSAIDNRQSLIIRFATPP
jgi:hypothetical protein